jgi:hypothetical protein
MEKLFAIITFSILLFGCASQEQAGSQNNPAIFPQEKNATPGGPINSEVSKSAADEFASFVSMRGGGERKVEYSIDLGSDVNGSSEMVSYSKGNKTRVDTSVMGFSARSYEMDGNLYTCGIRNESWFCIQNKMPTASGSGVATLSMIKNLSEFSIGSDGMMNIAGAAAKCFKLVYLGRSGPIPPGITLSYVNGTALKYCFSQEGIVLYARTAANATATEAMEIKADSYTKHVSDSDFELPALPKAFGAT